MMRFASDRGSRSPVRLLYSARTPAELAFRAELDAIGRAHPHLATSYSVTRPEGLSEPWTGRIGRIDAAWVREALQGLSRPKAYVVGLPEMVRSSLEMLRTEFGFGEDDLEWEPFMGY
jgi:ferredoxin-NADP reductase